MNAARDHEITVIGGGVSGCAAALAAAATGARVTLIEQRPDSPTPLHETDLLAELTGSVDLGAATPDKASGLLRAELRELGCPLIERSETARIGEATVTVDRRGFAQAITDLIVEHAGVQVRQQQAETVPEGVVVLATGPTTWSPLARDIHRLVEAPFTFAFWGRAPLVEGEAIQDAATIRAPRYPGADPNLFLPLTDGEMAEFIERLRIGERIAIPGLAGDMLADETPLVEDFAADNVGKLKGQALSGPHGDDFDAPGALRLAPDNREWTRLALADLMTTLTPDAQRHALDAIPALAGATLVRPGVIQRLPYLGAPGTLLPTLQLAAVPRVFAAGTLAGAFGYTEAIATGHFAGLGAARLAAGDEPMTAPADSLLGGLCAAIADPPVGHSGLIQANFGQLPDSATDGESKEARRARQTKRALEVMREFAAAATNTH
jgi:methylenetetrahydrofolate--tRNA-(uracil-5-)-methyltransferase